jgi:predicted trehalose synthase
MRALWDSPLSSSQAVTIAEPLAYHAELRVLLQGPIREERTLKDLMSWAVSAKTPEALGLLDEMMRKAAAGLAALHNTEVGFGAQWTWEDELDKIREQIERLGETIPSIAHAADPLLAQLKRLAGSTPLDALVPSHGSFRQAQVLLFQGQVGFIDFDSFSQSSRRSTWPCS